MAHGGRHSGGRGPNIGKKIKQHRAWNKFEHWKYPETVGNDTRADNINFNSHDASEYAIERMDNISTMTNEPFVMFEMMAIDETKAQEKIKAGSKTIKNLIDKAKAVFTGTSVGENAIDIEALGGPGAKGNINEEARIQTIATGWDYKGWIKDLMNTAERNYTGSIALYMPTDIQVNDSMMYNEDTRRIGAAIEGLVDGDVEVFNWTVFTNPAVLAIAGAGAAALGVPAIVGAVLGGSLGTIASTEVQRHTGKVMNPNELLRYQQTTLRTFTFNWTILPDNQNESHQAQGLIKFFRKSAHAKRTSSTLVTVPDHCVISFHGARDMIQLPPCYIESVNVTYNPNNSSFFKRNNSPVEIGLAVAFKEIIPIYAADVEKGY
jgi:hypothetical protein